MNQRSGVVTAFVREIDAKQGRVTLEYRGIEPAAIDHAACALKTWYFLGIAGIEKGTQGRADLDIGQGRRP